MSPKVTVLLAVHDGEPYVRESVASILGQTFGDFEFVIVDDASTDRTVEIVESFGDGRIRLLRNERNRGQVPSLNRGLREARGEYVARIDHDDWCRPTRLERQVAVLDAEPGVALVGTWMDVVEEGGRTIAQHRSTIADYAEFVFQTLTMQVLISHPAAMYRHAPVVELGGYDESTAPSEDKDLWRRLALACWDARVVPEPLVVYRLHAAQLSQVHANYQREMDAQSQERFLAALSPDAPVHPLRLLLSNDPAFRSEQGRDVLADLDRLLADAKARLRLDDAAATRVDRLVAARVLEVAREHPWRREARTLRAYGLRHLPPERRAAAASAYAASLVLSPIRHAVRSTGRRMADCAYRVAPLRALRGPAKRSRVARLIYSKLVGSR